MKLDNFICCLLNVELKIPGDQVPLKHVLISETLNEQEYDQTGTGMQAP